MHAGKQAHPLAAVRRLLLAIPQFPVGRSLCLYERQATSNLVSCELLIVQNRRPVCCDTILKKRKRLRPTSAGPFLALRRLQSDQK